MLCPMVTTEFRVWLLILHIECLYMPCRGPRDAEDNYRDVLAQMAEIMNIYSDRARFILVGDMNAP